MINYSAIPVAKRQNSPWDSFKLAVIITMFLLAIIALGGVLTVFVGHSGTIMPLISSVLFFGFIGLVIRTFVKGFQVFGKQKLWMRQFASDNGWKFSENKRTINDLATFPPSYIALTSNWNDVRCTVSGEVNGKRFELAHITYVQSTGILGALVVNVGRNRFAWISVLILEGHPNLQVKSDLVYEEANSYTYVVSGMNALYVDDIRSMFESVA